MYVHNSAPVLPGSQQQAANVISALFTGTAVSSRGHDADMPREDAPEIGGISMIPGNGR